MPADSSPGIPGWFIAIAVLMILFAIGGFIWRISVARKIASDAGLDPDRAATVAMLSNDGVDATYLASTLAPRRPAEPAPPAQRPKTAEQRLHELQALKDKGLITDVEYDARRTTILDSI